MNRKQSAVKAIWTAIRGGVIARVKPAAAGLAVEVCYSHGTRLEIDLAPLAERKGSGGRKSGTPRPTVRLAVDGWAFDNPRSWPAVEAIELPPLIRASLLHAVEEFLRNCPIVGDRFPVLSGSRESRPLNQRPR